MCAHGWTEGFATPPGEAALTGSLREVTAAPGGDRVARPRRELHDSLSAAAVAVLMAGLVWYLGCAGAARQSGSTAGRSADLGAPGQDPIGPAAAPLTEQMLILCWDGAQYNHTMTALRQGELPNLARIIAAATCLGAVPPK